jgi:hypothetical protein
LRTNKWGSLRKTERQIPAKEIFRRVEMPGYFSTIYRLKCPQQKAVPAHFLYFSGMVLLQLNVEGRKKCRLREIINKNFR